ncbi:hypothetical protein B0H10DRAFT_578310 [Mycena sp. CBHHK59/15]|nr:hypothetical protein B0H10DRAFT_578310 [Mycena sp. CBHHK59/15]
MQNNPGRDAASTIKAVKTLFLKWSEWDHLDWIKGEDIVWSEIHRLGRTGWTGRARSLEWATEVLRYAKEFESASEIGASKRAQAAMSLRRLAQGENIPKHISSELTMIATALGDSSELPPELQIRIYHNRLKIHDDPGNSGGSCTVRFGCYKIYGKVEDIAIKEFRFKGRSHVEIKSKLAQETWNWRELSKTTTPYIVEFFGADISDPKRLCLISRQMTNGNIVQYLNHSTTSSEATRLNLVLSGIRDCLIVFEWLISDLSRCANVLVDTCGVPRLADFGISVLIGDVLPNQEVEVNHEVDADRSGVASPAGRVEISSSSTSLKYLFSGCLNTGTFHRILR